jgi:hypothetical protein
VVCAWWLELQAASASAVARNGVRMVSAPG